MIFEYVQNGFKVYVENDSESDARIIAGQKFQQAYKLLGKDYDPSSVLSDPKIHVRPFVLCISRFSYLDDL